MKSTTLFFALILFSYSQKVQSENLNTSSAQNAHDNLFNSEEVDSTLITKIVTDTNKYEVSTYDNPKFYTQLIDHKESLEKLSNAKVFAKICEVLTKKLPEKHLEFLTKNSNYELLYFKNGNLFLEDQDDYVFFVYDKLNKRISIVVYDDKNVNYYELYRDMHVENGLENANCNYGAFGTLDYQIASNLISQEEYLRKNPEKYLEYDENCKITNINNDDVFILESGCFSDKISRDNLPNALCIATDDVYNNWECLRYNKEDNSFLIFYGQAFAD